jgi:predicted outer membrane protein
MDRPMVEFFASKLVLCNNGEIQMGQMAASKASNSEVKKFAEMLADEHAKFNDQLKPFAASYGEVALTSTSNKTSDKVVANKPVVPDRPNTPARGEKTATTLESTPSTGDSAVLARLYEVCQAAHQNQMTAGKEMMSKKSGAEFDKAFMAAQLVGHHALLAELKALESRAPSDFQAVIRSAKESVQNHAQKAESICKNLASESAKTETSNR